MTMLLAVFTFLREENRRKSRTEEKERQRIENIVRSMAENSHRENTVPVT